MLGQDRSETKKNRSSSNELNSLTLSAAYSMLDLRVLFFNNLCLSLGYGLDCSFARLRGSRLSPQRLPSSLAAIKSRTVRIITGV